MARFKLKASKKEFTSYAGLALVGQCMDIINVEAVVDGRIPVSQGIKTSDVVKSATGLLSIGKSDFEAIEPFREDRFFKQALNLRKVPGSVWLRQRLDRVSDKLREPLDEMSVRLIERADAPITAHKGYVCLDMDTFVMDQSGSKKEDVGRTYQGVDGYTPVAAYLGNEGWCIGLELRPGRWHSSLEIEYFLERLLPRVERLVPTDQAVLMRKDSGFDSAKLLFAVAAEKERWAAVDRSFEYLVKWNPRRQDKDHWVAQAEAAGSFVEKRPGKREALFSMSVERAFGKQTRRFRLVIRLIERTITRHGQHLLMPDIELEGWWTSLDDEEALVIERYRDHGTHEQFHSEFKTDLDLERLPSGKFDTNDVILRLGMLAYNCLRLLGQLGLLGDLAPIRHPAKRRRIRTVLQEIMYRAAQVIHKARQWWLDLGQASPVARLFEYLQHRLVVQPKAAPG
ncbi:IS1380 family transposase [Methylomonas methanica]|uniref:Transposase n=1 Tax=Methylomonas methanica (strain DSM 25384 / MC09) TaxID=857087 RepID=F9ZV21_METMM|nr:IS1380 family transposase [Methylomonas methanica]AEF99269.1 transposase [Methylomonas methanica MC09]AEF99454.1 transposase [Methylomonas methanica MC09]AEG00244.1 transposase [Methylomonas methanica MC09]AEG00416.1 transposase [Methylomonas methanica MC09]AEG01072.1 transposase [Methylomonas methanica MC09]